MQTDGFQGVAKCTEREPVISQESPGPYRPPLPVSLGQDLSPVMRRIPQERAPDGRPPMVPAVRLDMITVRDGWFAIGDGLDGVVITAERKMISALAMFSDPGRAGQGQAVIDLPARHRRFGSVFLGFDAAWTNWYHWLCFALARSALAAPVLPRDCPIILPDYAARADCPHLRYSETTWQQSIEAFGLADRVTLLPPGLYRAEAIRFVWTTPSEPTDVTLLHAFHNLFTSIAAKHAGDSASPARILISREGGDERIGARETTRLNQVAARFGFAKLHPENLDFAGQVAALAEAEAVLGVHGAGLTNILFGRDGLKVVEVNRPLDGGPMVRPWFYLLAHGRGMPYSFLNSAAGDLTEDRIAGALRAHALELAG